MLNLVIQKELEFKRKMVSCHINYLMGNPSTRRR